MLNTRMKLREMLSDQRMQQLPAACGVYAIAHKATGRAYIGSSINIKNRIGTHRNSLRAGTHSNSRLLADWQEHGEDAFAVGVLALCEPEERAQIESDMAEQILGDESYNWSGSGQKPTHDRDVERRIRRIRQAFDAWAETHLLGADDKMRNAAWNAWHDSAFAESARDSEYVEQLSDEEQHNINKRASFILFDIGRFSRCE